MWSSSLVSRRHAALVLSFLSSASAQSAPGASLFLGNGAPGAGQYQLVDNYDGATTFFDKWNYYSSYDPTYGHVQYVNDSVADQNGYTTISGGKAIISVDSTNQWPRGGPGRPAVRLISNNAYTHGMFVLDLNHMPYGCGTWPAYWLLGASPWPSNGEIDIIEGVNTNTQNGISMHTTPGCTITGSGQTGQIQTTDCDANVNGNSGCGTLLSNTATPNNYGQGLNDNGGGVYVTEWTSNYVKHWFFGRNSIPTSITNGAPDPSQFGTPAVNQQGSCNIDQHFNNMSIIINTDFCGAWAGQVYAYNSQCPQSSTASNSLDSCVDYVGNNPSAFADAYWSINSIRVYQMPPGAQPSSSYSTSLSSVTSSLASTNTVPHGMGATTSTLSSSPYTGPLSSASSTTASASSSSATPWICPGSNATQWTDYKDQQYTVQCGSDYNGGPLSGHEVVQVISFEACLELCDTLNGCLAVSFVGGNGAGTCYPKASRGVFVYDGATNGALRVAGPVSLSSSSSSTPASSTRNSSSSAMMSSSPTSSSAITSSSMMGTSTSASASSAPTSGLQCPSSNGTTYSSPSGTKYIVICDVNTDPGAFATSDEPDFESCINACGERSGPDCVAVTFLNGVCYFKSQYYGTSPGSGVEAAVDIAFFATPSSVSSLPPGGTPSMQTSSMMVTITQSSTSSSMSPVSTLTCPSVNGTQLTDSNGKKYTIECSSDTTGGAFATQATDGDFTQCMTACDSNPDCGAWTFQPYSSGGICYLKRVPASFVSGDSALVAGIVVTASPSSSSSTMASLSSSARSSSSVMSSAMTSSRQNSLSMSSGNSGQTSVSTYSSSPISSTIPPVSSSMMNSSPMVSPSSSEMMSSPASSSMAPLPTCLVSACRPSEAGAEDSACQDPYGNAYNLNCGVQYSGSVQRLVIASNINACLVECDTTDGCIAVNFANGTCSLLSQVTSNTTVEYNAAAATRPAEVSTVISTPTATSMMATSSTGASSVPTPHCNSTYTDPSSGYVYTVRCSTENSAPAFRIETVESGGFGSCFSICSANAGCVGFTFMGRDAGSCYLKGYIGTYSPAGPLVTSCFRISVGPVPSSASPATSEPGPITSISTVYYSSGYSAGPATSYDGSGPAPQCPTNTYSICGQTGSRTTCTSEFGNTYNVQCGIEYEGTVIDTSFITTKQKRAILPSFQDCQFLCDHTAGCVALNYEGNNCTLLSSVSGSSIVAGAIGAQILGYSPSGSTLVPPLTSIPGGSGGQVTVTPTETITPSISSTLCKFGVQYQILLANNSQLSHPEPLSLSSQQRR